MTILINLFKRCLGNWRVASEHGAHLDQPLSLRHDFTICRVGALRIRLGSVEADR